MSGYRGQRFGLQRNEPIDIIQAFAMADLPANARLAMVGAGLLYVFEGLTQSE